MVPFSIIFVGEFCVTIYIQLLQQLSTEPEGRLCSGNNGFHLFPYFISQMYNTYITFARNMLKTLYLILSE